MVIYGILGEKGSGKDTFAKFIQKHNDKFQLLHFADKLKQTCSMIFGLDRKFFEDRVLKETTLPIPLKIDDYTAALMYNLKIQIPKLGLSAHTPRQLIQYVGTDYVKNQHPLYWIDDAMVKVNKYAVIADTRFQDECDEIKKSGGYVIKLSILDKETKEDLHISESGVNNIKPDMHIAMYFGKMDLADKVAELLANNNIQSAKLYDYNNCLKFAKAFRQLSFIKYGQNLAIQKAAEMTLNNRSDVGEYLLRYYGEIPA